MDKIQFPEKHLRGRGVKNYGVLVLGEKIFPYALTSRQPSKNVPMQRKPTIYIVDDEREVLDAIAKLVQPIGAEVKTFSRADDFLSYFYDDGPGCLVLAVRIPDMSGLEIQAR